MITLPQVQVFQNFADSVAVDSVRLPAFLVGPLAHLRRYNVAQEKDGSFVGVYDHVGTLIDGDQKTCYSWPSRPAGSQIDQDYTKVFVENALLRYLDQNDDFTHLGRNRVRLPGEGLRVNPADPATYPRSALFLDRDVRPGDVVTLTGGTSLGADDVEVSTYVKAIEATDVAAVVASATSATGNQAPQIEASDSTANGGNSGDAAIDSIDPSGYDGSATGHLSEEYTIIVTQSSVGGDATTARLSVTSASGLDDQSNVVPAAFGSATAIGTRGLTVTWDAASDEFILGDEWLVEVDQAFTAPAVASGGTYNDTVNRVYEVEVVTGGAIATSEILCRALNGTDHSGPTTVAGSGSPNQVGTKGVTITFTGTALRKGDKYYIVATGKKPGFYDVLVLGHDLDVLAGSLGVEVVDLEISLYIRDSITVPQASQVTNGQLNWTQSDTEICLSAGIEVYHPQWTDDGDLEPLPLISTGLVTGSNQIYASYRAWRTDLGNDIYAISDPGAIASVFPGEVIDPDNPLLFALSCGLENNNGQTIRYAAVGNPASQTGWLSVLDRITNRDDVYGLVPLTKERSILDLFQAHIDSQSSELRNRWRVLWTCLTTDETVQRVGAATSTDGEITEAILEDDPGTSGIQYTLLRLVSANAQLDEAGILPGDTVRFHYTQGIDGSELYDEYTIDAVLSNNTLRLLVGGPDEVQVPERFEVWHNRTLNEVADAVVAECGTWNDRRVRAVWPPTIEKSGQEVDGVFLCASLAAYSGGVAPQQGLTNASIAGYTGVALSTRFSSSQLETMVEGGAWIVNQKPTGEVYTVWAVTTGDHADINQREEVVTRNFDSISYYQANSFAPFIGRVNVVPGTIDMLDARFKANMQFLRQSFYQESIGGQIIDGEVLSIRPSPVFKDRLVANLRYDMPYPLNSLYVQQLVG